MVLSNKEADVERVFSNESGQYSHTLISQPNSPREALETNPFFDER
jgi:hypothetical protein